MATRLDRGLILLLVASFGVKLLAAWAVRDVPCQGDQCAFLWAARSVLEGNGFTYGTDDWDDGHTPPLYVLFLSACLFVGGGSLSAVRIAQALVGTLTVFLTDRIGTRVAGAPAGRVAAWAVAFFPEFVAYSQFAFAENLFLCLLVAITGAALSLEHRRRVRDAVLLGLLLGLAALTRSMMLVFVPVTVVWWVVVTRERLAKSVFVSLAIALTALVTILPWSLYNQARFDRFLLLATNAGNVVHRNLNFTAPENYDYKSQRLTHWFPDRPPRSRCQEENPVDRYRCELEGAREFVMENPGRTLNYVWLKWRGLWNPSSFFLRYVAGGVFGGPELWSLRLWVPLFGLVFVAATLLGTLGFVTARWARGPWLWFATVFLFWHAIYGLAFGMSRYRMPLMWFFLVAAAAAWTSRREWASRFASVDWRTWLACVPWFVLLGASWVLYSPLLWRLFWQGA